MLDMAEDGIAQALDVGLGGVGDQQARAEIAQTLNHRTDQYGAAAQQQVLPQALAAAQPFEPLHQECGQRKWLGADDRVDRDADDLGC